MAPGLRVKSNWHRDDSTPDLKNLFPAAKSDMFVRAIVRSVRRIARGYTTHGRTKFLFVSIIEIIPGPRYD